jgi:hypothetical protein
MLGPKGVLSNGCAGMMIVWLLVLFVAAAALFHPDPLRAGVGTSVGLIPGIVIVGRPARRGGRD